MRESRSCTYDHVGQVLHWTSYQRWHERGGQERTKTTRIALRYTFPQELAALVHHNGFTIARRYGEWDGEPLSAASPSIIVVCRNAPNATYTHQQRALFTGVRGIGILRSWTSALQVRGSSQGVR